MSAHQSKGKDDRVGSHERDSTSRVSGARRRPALHERYQRKVSGTNYPIWEESPRSIGIAETRLRRNGRNLEQSARRPTWHRSCQSRVGMGNQQLASELSGRSVLINEAAALLGVSRRTVYYRIRDGRLRTVRTRCGSQRVLWASIEAAQRGDDRAAADGATLEA